MALAVLNYPTLSPEDYEWVQSIREQHDTLYFSFVEPHITFVLPTEGVDEAGMLAHVRSQVAGLSPFEVVFRCAILGDADFQDHGHVFLVPDEGNSQIVWLHDRLYTSVLEPGLRLESPYIPHIGIANSPTLEGCKAIVDEINAKKFELRAQVEALDVVGFDGKRVWTIEQIELTGEGS